MTATSFKTLIYNERQKKDYFTLTFQEEKKKKDEIIQLY